MTSTTNKVHVPMPWSNQIPQYIYNFQNPQQLPPYQGYPFPMQPIPPHYAMAMQWPPSLKESAPVKKEKFLNKNGLEHSGEDGETESSDSEVQSDSDSYMQQNKRNSSTDSSHRKKHRKKSSKTVVIRNINYITPKRRSGEKASVSDESSYDEDDFTDEDSLQQKVHDAIGSLDKLHKSKSSNHGKKGSVKSNHTSNGSHDAGLQDFGDGVISNPSEGGKKNENWDAFQNLLMRDEEENVSEVGKLHPMDVPDEHFIVKSLGNGITLANNRAMDLELEKVPKQRMAAGDSFVVTQRDGGSENKDRMEDIESAENLRSVMKRRDSTDADLVIPQRVEESGGRLGVILSATESSTIKPRNREDWFVISHSGKPENENSIDDIIFNGDQKSSSDGDYLNVENSRKNVAVDDSFMIHVRPAVDDLCDSPWKTDISMAADINLSSQSENGTVKENHEVLGGYEPNDLCVVLERDSGLESARESWTSDHGIDISFMETETRSSSVETTNDAAKKLPSNCENPTVKKKESSGRKVPGKEVRPRVSSGSPGNNKTGIASKNKKPSLPSRPIVQKSKLEKVVKSCKLLNQIVVV